MMEQECECMYGVTESLTFDGGEYISLSGVEWNGRDGHGSPVNNTT